MLVVFNKHLFFSVLTLLSRILGGVFRLEYVLYGVADARGDFHVVHRVEMYAAHVVVDQVHNLLRGVVDAGVKQRFGILPVAAEDARELSGYAGAA